MEIREITEKIKERVDCTLVATQMLGLETKKCGAQLSILCPNHGDNHYGNCFLKKEFVHCFACGWHADAITLVMTVYSCTFFEAVEKINSFFNLGIDLSAPKQQEVEDTLRLMASELALLNINDKGMLKLLYDTDRNQFWEFLDAAAEEIAETYAVLEDSTVTPEVETILGTNSEQIRKILDKLKILKGKNKPSTVLIIRG